MILYQNPLILVHTVQILLDKIFVFNKKTRLIILDFVIVLPLQ